MFKKYFSTFNFYSRRLLSIQKSNKFYWAEQEKILMEPFEYIQKLPCKYLGMIGPIFNYWLQVPEDKLNSIQEALRALVSWSLLLDDIQDDSAFRYGVPAAHRIFGVGVTINAATKALLVVQNLMIELGHPLAPKILIKRLEENFLGQGIDMYWRDNFLCPTEEAHIEMTKYKSGSFFVFPVELMQLFSKNQHDYTGIIMTIATYYEILDDYYNLFHPDALNKLSVVPEGKYGTCSDITEGKITLPVIHAMQFSDIASELADIYKQRTKDPKLQNHVISLLKKHGSDEYIRNKMRKLEADIRTEITRLGGNPRLTVYMDELCFQNQEIEQCLHTYS